MPDSEQIQVEVSSHPTLNPLDITSVEELRDAPGAVKLTAPATRIYMGEQERASAGSLLRSEPPRRTWKGTERKTKERERRSQPRSTRQGGMTAAAVVVELQGRETGRTRPADDGG